MNWADFFYYDETSPSCLRWAVDVYGGRKHTVKAVSCGDVAGSINKGGYYTVMRGGVTYLVHRIIYEMHHGATLVPRQKVDHENNATADNRISNLRLVSQAVNSRNCRMSRLNTSGVTGVYYQKSGNWAAMWTTLEGRQKGRVFSVKKYGSDEAKARAIAARTKAIAELNKAGAGYTERHGE